ncbi:MAG TPA: GNAT family protein [Planctomycetota bacterium]|nr:GNAT family protein [Planctomycetota bacterium]
MHLVPLEHAHTEALFALAQHEDIWRYFAYPLDTLEAMQRWVTEALRDADARVALPFTLFASDGQGDDAGDHGIIAGSTRFGAMVLDHARVEIGWTFVGRAWQRTAVNTEAKLLLLGYAFEVLGCRRVELKTDANNARSRAAIQRLGASEEGTLRKHMRYPDGRPRDTVYYSIVDDEWPKVRAGLEARLSRST